MKTNKKSGMALILVLSFSTFLLIMAISYTQTNLHNRPINERHFERAQADFIGQGIVQLAAMKFKKRPAEFYFAWRAMRAGVNAQPLENYLTNDSTLNGTFTDHKGNRYRFNTRMQLITNQVFDTDAIRIVVTIEQINDSDVVLLTRVQEHVIEAVRRPL